MKKEDYASLEKMTISELLKKLEIARRDSASIKINARVGQEKNTSTVRMARKNVARIQTAISAVEKKELLAV